MFDCFYEVKDDGVHGFMPSGEEKVFATIDDYVEQFLKEEDEFIDEMARLEEEKFVEYPEDYVA